MRRIRSWLAATAFPKSAEHPRSRHGVPRPIMLSGLARRAAVTWAILATPLVLAMFVGHPFFSRVLAEGTGVTVTPWVTGGPVMSEAARDGYRILIRRPVFDGLLGPRSTGFVQVEWLPSDGHDLPGVVDAAVDVDLDGAVDFIVVMETRESHARLAMAGDGVLGIDRIYRLPRDRVVRVALRRSVS